MVRGYKSVATPNAFHPQLPNKCSQPCRRSLALNWCVSDVVRILPEPFRKELR